MHSSQCVVRVERKGLKAGGHTLLGHHIVTSCDIGLSATTSVEISCGSSTQKFHGANSKMEKHIDSSEEFLTDLLTESDTQQSPS